MNLFKNRNEICLVIIWNLHLKIRIVFHYDLFHSLGLFRMFPINIFLMFLDFIIEICIMYLMKSFKNWG